jgi:hypothetical protein
MLRPERNNGFKPNEQPLAWPQGHGPASFTALFVDGHSACLKQSKWLMDPTISGAADDWSTLGWTDFQ